MNMRYFFLIALPFLLLIPGSLSGSWGQNGCGPVGLPVVPVAPVGYQWEQSPTDADCWGLRFNGVQIGAWRQSNNIYCPLVGDSWGGACTPPTGLPAKPALSFKHADCPCCGEECNCSFKPCGKPSCKCVLSAGHIESDGTLNFGLDLRPHEPRRVHNGHEVSRTELLRAIGGKASIPNDAGELALTVIGPDADSKAVLSDLSSSPTLAPWKGKIKVQDYAPDHWAVKDAGFLTTATTYPVIYCQGADGKVLHRQDGYRGAEMLAEALRKADPNYQSANDPDLNKKTQLPSLADLEKFLADVPGWVWAAGAILLLVWWQKKEVK